MKHCLVFNSTTRGKQTRVDSCFTTKEYAKAEAARHNRTAGYGGFYSVHKAATIAMWRRLKYDMNFEALDTPTLAGVRSRPRQRRVVRP